MKTMKITLIAKVPDTFYLPAFVGALQGFITSIKVIKSKCEVVKENVQHG